MISIIILIISSHHHHRYHHDLLESSVLNPSFVRTNFLSTLREITLNIKSPSHSHENHPDVHYHNSHHYHQFIIIIIIPITFLIIMSFHHHDLYTDSHFITTWQPSSFPGDKKSRSYKSVYIRFFFVEKLIISSHIKLMTEKSLVEKCLATNVM